MSEMITRHYADRFYYASLPYLPAMPPLFRLRFCHAMFIFRCRYVLSCLLPIYATHIIIYAAIDTLA